MLKNMTLSLAMRYCNCSNNPHANNVFGFGPALKDDIQVLEYRKMKIRLYITTKKYLEVGIMGMDFSPRLPKRQKRRNHPAKSRNRFYFRSNMNLLERRRFIKQFHKGAISNGQ